MDTMYTGHTEPFTFTCRLHQKFFTGTTSTPILQALADDACDHMFCFIVTEDHWSLN